MIEETTFESVALASAPASPKVHRIGLYNRLAIIISGVFIALSLLIGWVLWLTLFREGIDYYINVFNSITPDTLKMSFDELSIIIFVVSGLAVGIVTVPFIFTTGKNSYSALFSFISFIFSILLVVGFVIFAFIRFNTIKSLVNNNATSPLNTISVAVAAFLPWALAALGAIFLVGNSIWLLINISSKYRSNALSVPVAKPEKPAHVIAPTPIPQESEISVPLAAGQPETLISTPSSLQPINITVTNNTAFPNQQPNIQNQSGVEPTPTYTSPNVSAPANTGAYVSEAVVSNQNHEHSNENNTVHLAEPTLATSASETSIYSRTNNDIPTTSSSISKYDDLPTASNESLIEEPEELSNATTSSVGTSYEPQNQGGFDIQGAAQGQPDESEFRQEKPPVSNYEYSPQQKTAMRRISQEPPKPKVVPKTYANHHWTLDQIQTVWEKAEIIDGVSDKLYRKDYAGAWMFRDSFTTDLDEANNEKTYSWTIVLHRPTSQSGTVELYNLDPMNVVNAKTKGEHYPRWTTKLSSRGNENVIKEQNWKARS